MNYEVACHIGRRFASFLGPLPRQRRVNQFLAAYEPAAWMDHPCLPMFWCGSSLRRAACSNEGVRNSLNAYIIIYTPHILFLGLQDST